MIDLNEVIKKYSSYNFWDMQRALKREKANYEIDCNVIKLFAKDHEVLLYYEESFLAKIILVWKTTDLLEKEKIIRYLGDHYTQKKYDPIESIRIYEEFNMLFDEKQQRLIISTKGYGRVLNKNSQVKKRKQQRVKEAFESIDLGFSFLEIIIELFTSFH
jgi:hypothetical protein